MFKLPFVMVTVESPVVPFDRRSVALNVALIDELVIAVTVNDPAGLGPISELYIVVLSG